MKRGKVLQNYGAVILYNDGGGGGGGKFKGMMFIPVFIIIGKLVQNSRGN
jgi:hypothetical protein